MKTSHIHVSTYMVKRAATQRRIYTPDNTPANTLLDYHEPKPGWHGMGGTTPAPVAPKPIAPQPGHISPGKGGNASTVPGAARPPAPRQGLVNPMSPGWGLVDPSTPIKPQPGVINPPTGKDWNKPAAPRPSRKPEGIDTTAMLAGPDTPSVQDLIGKAKPHRGPIYGGMVDPSAPKKPKNSITWKGPGTFTP